MPKGALATLEAFGITPPPPQPSGAWQPPPRHQTLLGRTGFTGGEAGGAAAAGGGAPKEADVRRWEDILQGIVTKVHMIKEELDAPDEMGMPPLLGVLGPYLLLSRPDGAGAARSNGAFAAGPTGMQDFL